MRTILLSTAFALVSFGAMAQGINLDAVRAAASAPPSARQQAATALTTSCNTQWRETKAANADIRGSGPYREFMRQCRVNGRQVAAN